MLPLGTKSFTLDPGYSKPTDFQLEIHVPPGPTYNGNGNSGGFFVNDYQR